MSSCLRVVLLLGVCRSGILWHAPVGASVEDTQEAPPQFRSDSLMP